MMMILVAAAVAYLLGSIPTAVWYGKRFFGIDIRQKGSGNAGASNTFRVLGKKPGTIVLVIDVLKGWLAASLAVGLYNYGYINENQIVTIKLTFGFIAILGHLYPVFAHFKGGKGVATSLGLVLALSWPTALACMGVFVVVLLVSGYISLSSMLGAVVFPMLSFLGFFGESNHIITGFGVVLALVVVYAHRSNIGRIMNGNESRVRIFK
jgi:acyl phosphate:glycerol-3-phosphate acyltransferase